MKEIIKIRGQARMVFDIIKRLGDTHPQMTLKEYQERMS